MIAMKSSMKNNGLGGSVKVSVVTVVFNAACTIEATVRSVLGQSYGNIEYVVIDGGSNDGTIDVLNRYKDKITYFRSEPDEGIYDAMNKGVRAATGEWVGIMNAGDAFSSKDVLSMVFGEGKLYSGIDVLYGDAVSVEGRSRILCRAPDKVNGLSESPVYRQGASFVRRSTHLKFLFDLSLQKRLGFALDFEQMHRMFKEGCVFQKVPVTVLDYERRGASTVSPFKPGYYNYLITHDLHCSPLMRVWLVWLACWRKLVAIIGAGGL